MAYNLKERRFMSVKMYKILLKAKYQKTYPRGEPLKVQGLSGKMMNVFRIYLSVKWRRYLCVHQKAYKLETM